MKKVTYLLALVILACIFNCNQQKKAAPVNLSNLALGKHCYNALFEKDSASLSLDVAASGNITGKLTITFTKPLSGGSEVNTGDITGEFRGDTLFADYNFTSSTGPKNVYKNPVALLHKGDSLIMGSGRVMQYLGRNYFDDKTPINFTKSRFRFVPIDCK